MEKHGGGSLQGTSVAATCRKVTEELMRLRRAVQSVVPGDTLISFHFDDRLHINIDVRDLCDLAKAETRLPAIADGIFSNLRRSLADHHSFRHRLTAEVEAER
jgi:2-polyprenyl-6-methoxyphenol hydroxylase-like FAD-dependent oxidoreductase